MKFFGCSLPHLLRGRLPCLGRPGCCKESKGEDFMPQDPDKLQYDPMTMAAQIPCPHMYQHPLSCHIPQAFGMGRT